MGLPMKELSKDGPRNKAELFALLSEAKHRFGQATNALIRPEAKQDELDAGVIIFTATLNALKFWLPYEELPTFDNVAFDRTTDDAILPLPVLATLGFFRDDIRSVCLTQLNFKPLHQYDGATLAYPNTILWGHLAIERLIGDLVKVFSRERNTFPILSNPHVRAYQLCRYGQEILGNELERIGEPLHAQIFLPK